VTHTGHLIWVTILLTFFLLPVLVHLVSIGISHSLLFLLLSELLHVVHTFLVGHLERSHVEGFVIQERDDSLLAKHKLNNAVSLMSVELVLVLTSCGDARGRATRGSFLGSASDHIDTDAQTWSRRINLHLGLLLVLFALLLDLINSRLEQDLKLSLASELLVILGTGIFQILALMLHHFPELVHDTLIPSKLFLLRLSLTLWYIYDRA
jgi:hypothetical protein